MWRVWRWRRRWKDLLLLQPLLVLPGLRLEVPEPVEHAPHPAHPPRRAAATCRGGATQQRCRDAEVQVQRRRGAEVERERCRCRGRSGEVQGPPGAPLPAGQPVPLEPGLHHHLLPLGDRSPHLQGSGVRGQGSGVRCQGSGVRGQGSGVRCQGSGVRRQGEPATCPKVIFMYLATSTLPSWSKSGPRVQILTSWGQG